MSNSRCFRFTVGILSFAGLFFVSGCVLPSEDVAFDSRSFEVLTGASSTPIAVDVGMRHTALHLDISGAADVAVDRVLDPSGTVVMDYLDFPSPRLLTQGIIPIGQNSSFNWPIRESDPPLRLGTWTIEVAAIDDQDQYVEGIPLSVTVQRKADSNWSKGKVRARIHYDASSDADPEVRNATEQAVIQWKEIYRAAGIQLQVRYASTTLGLDLESPGDETQAYADFDDPEDAGEIAVVVGHYIDGGLEMLGISGGVPGAIAESPRGVVLLSWLALAGKDAQFQQREIDLYAETMAHEVGHYLGLFHPVEDSWDSWDMLDDTVECETFSECAETLGENLMYPLPICDGASCRSQRTLTGQQESLIHRYAGTL